MLLELISRSALVRILFAPRWRLFALCLRCIGAMFALYSRRVRDVFTLNSNCISAAPTLYLRGIRAVFASYVRCICTVFEPRAL